MLVIFIIFFSNWKIGINIKFKKISDNMDYEFVNDKYIITIYKVPT